MGPSVQGFEVRGTEISKRVRSHASLFEETLHTHSLAPPAVHTRPTKVHQRHLATNASYAVADTDDDVESSDYTAGNDTYAAADAYFCDRPREY